MARQTLQLQRHLAELRAQTPIRVGALTLAPQGIIIIAGQSMGTNNGVTTYGIEKFAGTLSSISVVAYDPGTVNATTGAETAGPTPALTAWPSGLGYGTARFRGGYKRVIVVNDSRGGCANALVGGDSSDTTYAPSVRQVTIIASRQLTVTLSDGTSILAWSPDLG